ncbi:unnamed protein product [Strongylus vulgaris]|uniref:Peptidase C13 family protein n=1 Tax=Strongylus vulgaris TaxID=40348 RepID=A0A3P7LCI8_STRVU|nr:unnamed protein product [Strongylus vulgaris]
MMYDDVAYDPGNPHPGELRNIQNGPDYRKGMVVDYRATSVNKYVFQAVLTGNTVLAAFYEGSGRVLKSTTADNVFIFYSDHGAYNVLGMPSGPPITKSDLQSYIETARSAGKFHKLSIYVEACESGSMLSGLEKDDFVNGLTASSATEDSYACNCAGPICYADLFSYKWITNSEQKREQFQEIFNNLLQILRVTTDKFQEDHELVKDLQDYCYETLVLQFDEHCFPLRNNAFAFGSLRRFRSFCVKANSNVIQRAINTMRLYCMGNSSIAEVQGVE